MKFKAQIAVFLLLFNFGYAYNYQKTIVLSKNKSEVRIHLKLKNTGEKNYATTYFHNFFRFDFKEVGTDYVIKFPKNINVIDNFDFRVTIQEIF
ncbi:MAG: hypothetical protein MI975_25300 [Cytophagales bacterium]|nr:hypothetical protein [Cytophagales bacterium]